MNDDDHEEFCSLDNMRLDGLCVALRLFFAICFHGNRNADLYRANRAEIKEKNVHNTASYMDSNIFHIL